MVKLHFEDEDGNIVNEAYFDAYAFGDRLLEGVIYKATIVNNEIVITYADKTTAEYMEQFNEKMWFENAKAYIEDEPDLMSKNGKKEIYLVKEEE